MTNKVNRKKFSRAIAIAVIVVLTMSMGLSGCAKDEGKDVDKVEKPVETGYEKDLEAITKASEKFKKLESGILAYYTVLGDPVVDFESPELQYDTYTRTAFKNIGDKRNYVKEDTSIALGYNELPMYSKNEDGKMFFYIDGAWREAEADEEGSMMQEVDVFSSLQPTFNDKYIEAIKQIDITEEQGMTVYTIDLHPGKYFAYVQQKNSKGEPIENPVDENNEDGKYNEIYSVDDKGVLVDYKSLLVNADGSEGWTMAGLASYNSEADLSFYDNPFGN